MKPIQVDRQDRRPSGQRCYRVALESWESDCEDRSLPSSRKPAFHPPLRPLIAGHLSLSAVLSNIFLFSCYMETKMSASSPCERTKLKKSFLMVETFQALAFQPLEWNKTNGHVSRRNKAIKDRCSLWGINIMVQKLQVSVV